MRVRCLLLPTWTGNLRSAFTDGIAPKLQRSNHERRNVGVTAYIELSHPSIPIADNRLIRCLRQASTRMRKVQGLIAQSNRYGHPW